jgi:hypothetical protein
MPSIQIDLSELIRIIRTNGNKQANSLFARKGKDTKIRQLARKFAFEKNRDEHAWAHEIFQDSEYSTSYTWHRSQLRRELLDQIFHLDIRSGPERRKAMYRLRKSIFSIKTLLLFGARRTAMSMIPVAMKLAETFEMTSDRITMLEALTSNAALNGWKLKFERYDRELQSAMKLNVAEIQIISLNHRLDVETVGHARPTVHAQRLAETAPQEARQLFREFPTFNVGLAYYRIVVSSAQLLSDFGRGLTMCSDAVAFLSRFPKLNTTGIQGEFELYRLWMALSSRSFEDATEYTARCQKLFREGTNNWFIAREYEFLLQMHTKQWREAAELRELVTKQTRFASQPEQVRQKWELFGHYVALTSESGLKHIPPSKSNAFGKILREIPIYHHDEGGYNTSLFILQYLILVAQGDRKSLTERSEAIAKFVYRNYRGQHELQAYAFLRALLLLVQSEFNLKITKNRAKRYIEIFSSTTREKIDETQTLPFNLMWEWITNSIGTEE